MARALFLLLLTVAAPVLAAESDPYWAWRQPPNDATRWLDRAINLRLVRGLAVVNATNPSSCPPKKHGAAVDSPPTGSSWR